jgi:hypothetical protein
LKSPRADVVMVVTRSKSVVKTNSLKKKLGSMGSLTSLTEKNDSIESEGMLVKKSLHVSKSMDVDLDNISNEGFLEKLVELVEFD